MLIYPPLTKRMFNINVSVFLFLCATVQGIGWCCGSDFNDDSLCTHSGCSTFEGTDLWPEACRLTDL